MMYLTLTAALVGCSTDPEQLAASKYVNAVQPLMLENRFLSERRLQLAAEIYNQNKAEEAGRIEADPALRARVLTSWRDEIAPLASHLAVQAELVEPPPEWKDVHTNLVVTWTDRSHAYGLMVEALMLSDQDSWRRARELQNAVVKREEAWFNSVRSRLKPLDLALEPYP